MKVLLLSVPEYKMEKSITSYVVGAVSAAVIAIVGTFVYGIYPAPILRIAHPSVEALIG